MSRVVNLDTGDTFLELKVKATFADPFIRKLAAKIAQCLNEVEEEFQPKAKTGGGYDA